MKKFKILYKKEYNFKSKGQINVHYNRNSLEQIKWKH